MFVAIANTPRDYAWGSTQRDRGVPRRRADRAPPRPSSGSVRTPGRRRGSLDEASVGHADLAAWIAPIPSARSARRSHATGPRLPFLLKVLAAAEPLSLQAHPTPEQARAGFAREEAEGVAARRVRPQLQDPFHKPELIVAVSDTLRRAVRIPAARRGARRSLETLRAADAASRTPEPGALDLLAARLDGPDPAARHRRVAAPRRSRRRHRRGRAGSSSGSRRSRHPTPPALAVSRLSFETVGALAEAYPGDPGIVISLLLNRVRLRRGEALYLAAGNIHAYLDGPRHRAHGRERQRAARRAHAQAHRRVRAARGARLHARSPPPRLAPRACRRRGRSRSGPTCPTSCSTASSASDAAGDVAARARSTARRSCSPRARACGFAGPRRGGARSRRSGSTSRPTRRDRGHRARVSRGSPRPAAPAHPPADQPAAATATSRSGRAALRRAAGRRSGVVCSTFTKWCRMTAAAPKPVSRAISSSVSDGLLEQLLRAQEPLAVQPGVRRRARLGAEAAGERARRHERLAGEQVDREVVVEVLEHPLGDLGERVAAGIRAPGSG